MIDKRLVSRAAAVVLAAGLALPPLTAGNAAFAAPAAQPAIVGAAPAGPVGDAKIAHPDEAKKAAEWLAGQFVDGKYLLDFTGENADVGNTIDGILALISADAQPAVVESATAWVKSQVAGYLNPPVADEATKPNPSGKAARVVLLADTLGEDAKTFGGVDAAKILKENAPKLKDDPYSSALAVIALTRIGELSKDAVQPLLDTQKQEGPDAGALAYPPSQWGDGISVDSTALGLEALLAADEADAAAAAKNWLVGKKNAAHYWDAYSPANTAGLVIPALRAAGVDTAASEQWLISKQLKDGSFGASLEETAGQAYATAQAIYGLTTRAYSTNKLLPAAPISVPKLYAAANAYPDASKKTADFIAREFEDQPALTGWSGQPSVGSTVDALYALVSDGTQQDLVKKSMAWLATEENVNAYLPAEGNAAGAAAKLAILADATGADPQNFGGRDLVQLIQKDGAKLSKNAWNSALAVIALARVDALTDTVLNPLLKAQLSDGSFSWGDKGDVDFTAVALEALAAAGQTEPANRAKAWLEQNLNEEGYWSVQFSPNNSAGIAIPAVKLAGGDVTKPQQWIASRQLASGAFSNTKDGTNDDMLASVQAMFGLTGRGYATLGKPMAPAPTPAPAPAFTESGAIGFYVNSARETFGKAISDETTVDGVAWQDFEKGRIYWTLSGGIVPVTNAFYATIKANPDLGAALGWEIVRADGAASQLFANGALAWQPGHGVYTTTGAIHAAWMNAGGATGSFGLPTSKEITLGGGKVVQHFEGGDAYWAPGAGAWFVYRGNKAEWERLDGINGALGAPTGNEVDLGGNVVVQTFEHGRIYWSPNYGARAVHGGILTAFLNAGGHDVLGVPKTGEYAFGTGVRQEFVKANITWR